MTSNPASSMLRDFRAVYRAHHGFVWHALHRFGVEHAVIEDAVQDVFVVAYRRRDEFYGASTKAWLYGIARRVASNYRRSDRRREQRQRSVHATQRRGQDPEAHEAIHALDRYLSGLAEEDRELFLLSELEGMTGPEIAEARGRNVNTVYTRIGKLRRDLRDRLGEIDRARDARPRATAQRWAAIVPLLRAPAVAVTTGLGSTVIGVGIGAIAAAGVLVGANVVLPAERSEPHVVAAVEAPRQAPEAEPRDSPEPEAIASPPPPIAEPPPRNEPPDPPPIVARRSTPTSKPADPADDLAAQNELLARAAQALERGRGDEALRITHEHASRFPASPLGDLRIALRIEALCASSKPAQARAEAQQFLEKRPGSPVARRIARSCGGPPRNPADADKPGT